jgi:hypothetical protein
MGGIALSLSRAAAAASSRREDARRAGNGERRSVPEGLSTGEVAHTMGHKHGHAQPVDRRSEVIEILEAIVLAIVAVATAWSGYQTARWDSRQAYLYGISSRERFTADQRATRGGQEQLYDASTFGSWLAATATGNVKAAALFERRFRPEFRPAFRAWLKTDPFHDPKAPPGPLVMPQYRNASLVASAVASKKASAAFEEGTKAREHGDDYLRNTVLLATVLFLTALAGRFKTHAVRASLLGVSAVILALCVYYAITFPRA